MTREEAIQMIQSMGKYLSAGNPIWEVEPVREATRMAIEALSGADTYMEIKLEKRYPNSTVEDITDAFMRGVQHGMTMPSADRPKTISQTDTILIAVALRYLINDEERNELDRKRAEQLRQEVLEYGASMCSDYRPKGEWRNREHTQVDEDSYEVADCSECGAEITIEYPYDNFCPNCGADMRKERRCINTTK